MLAGLSACDAIHLSGGDTFSFLVWLRRTRVLEALHRYAMAGGVLIGASAGSILMTPSVATASLCGDERDPCVSDDRALALVPFGFWPHYQSGREQDARCLTPNEAAWPIYACPDGAGVVVQGNSIEQLGDVVVLERHGGKLPA